MSDWAVPLTRTTVGQEEAQAAARVLISGWLTQGAEVAAFESEFAAQLRLPFAAAVASCTLGLELSYAAVGVRPGDEVIVPGLTFVATANAARRLGARPVFADITSESDLSVDFEDVIAKLTTRTRAVAIMHYGGFAARVSELRARLQATGYGQLPILEDCAHAPGAHSEDGSCGGLGTIGVFSFFGNKNMTTGEGGMITASTRALDEAVRELRTHGLSTSTWERHRRRALSYDVLQVGTNAKLDEVRAAIGRAQLNKLLAANRRRAQVRAWYEVGIQERGDLLAKLTVPYLGWQRRVGAESAHHLMVVLLPQGCAREAVMVRLHAAGIQTSVHYPPLHRLSCNLDLPPVTLPRLESTAPRLLTLPLSPFMTKVDIARVLDELSAALR